MRDGGSHFQDLVPISFAAHQMASVRASSERMPSGLATAFEITLMSCYLGFAQKPASKL